MHSIFSELLHLVSNSCLLGELMVAFLYQSRLNNCLPQSMVYGSLVCLGCDLAEPALLGTEGIGTLGNGLGFLRDSALVCESGIRITACL